MPRLPKLLICSAFALFSVMADPLPAAPPAAPSVVVAFAPNQSRVHLSWIDNAIDETGYTVERWNGTDWVAVRNLPPNFEVFRDSAPTTAEALVNYRVAAVKGAEKSPFVAALVLKPAGALDLFIDTSTAREIPEGVGARAGVPISHQIIVSNGTPERFISRYLPQGLSLNESTGLITGTIATPGVYRSFVGVEFDGGKRFEQLRYFRVLPAPSTPVFARPGYVLPKQNIGVDGGLDITSFFRDPARPKGAWFVTPAGPIIVALYDRATPKTVSNFLGYVSRRDYNGVYLHRSDYGFVIQSGGYKPASATAPATSWGLVTKRAEVQNEPGFTNKRGTIAMAKVGSYPPGDPRDPRDSATCEWFFSISAAGYNNPAILDAQNGGFTAFGEVVGSSSQNAVDILNSQATKDYTGVITGPPSGALTDVPVVVPTGTTPPAVPTANHLIRFNAVYEAPPVVITLVSNSAPSVVRASVSGMILFIKSLGPIGTAYLRLRATNLDGNSVDYVLPVRIDDTVTPAIGLTRVTGSTRPNSATIHGTVVDDRDLASWRYRINNGPWRIGGYLRGKRVNFSTVASGFKRGRNTVTLRAFDRRGNSSQIRSWNLTFN